MKCPVDDKVSIDKYVRAYNKEKEFWEGRVDKNEKAPNA